MTHFNCDRQRRLSLELLEGRHLLAASPWTNPLDPHDATGDGEITARDALVIINQISRDHVKGLISVAPPILGPAGVGKSFHFDTTGDGRITALDALRSINHMAKDRALAEGDQVVDPSPPPTDRAGIVDLVLSDGFARSSRSLSSAEPRDVFRFVADSAHVAIDTSSVADESLADIVVLDESGAEIARGSQLGHRSPSEGIKFPTTVGRTYQIVVELMPGATSSEQSAAVPFSYTLDVLQFDLQRWPGVTISNVHGYQWIENLGPDSELGDDIHGDDPDDATLVRPFNQEIAFESHIDSEVDVDWFRVPVASNAVHVGVEGSETPLDFVIDVFDAGLHRIEPTTSLAQPGQAMAGPYLVDRSDEVFLRLHSKTGAVGQYAFSFADVGN